MTEIDHFFCTDCGGPVVAVAEDHDLLFCQTCEKYFEIPPEHRENGSDRADELDGLRIRQLATMKRAAYRSRSHAVIACIVCVVATVQLIAMTWSTVRHRTFGAWSIVVMLLIPIATFGALYFYRRALALHREAIVSSRETSANCSPDFTSLRDGSDQWKRLDDVQ